jgi:16S rRNA processing protein RimM
MRAANESQQQGVRRAGARVEIGRVLRPRGLDGSLLVALFGDDCEGLRSASEIALAGDPGELTFRVREIEELAPGRDGRPRISLKLSGLSERSRAEHWSGAALSIDAGSLPELAEDEFYWHEILGARCRDRAGAPLGTLDEIWPTPGHDVLVVRQHGETRLLPASDKVIVRFDRESGELWLDPPAQAAAEGS